MALRDGLQQLHDLIGTTATAMAEDAGGLTINFANGDQLHVDPGGEFEPWNYAGPNGHKVVSLPGGGLTGWPANQN